MTIKYICSVVGCNAECRRKTDMEAHIRRIHEQSKEGVEFILAKCEARTQENNSYVDPGILVYKGANQSQNSTTASVVPEISSVIPEIVPEIARVVSEMAPVIPETAPILEVRSAPYLLPYTTEQPKKRKLSLEQYRESREASNKVNQATQTSWKDYGPLALPPLPQDKEEMQECLAWMCNAMDQLGKTREIVKKKLAAMDSPSELEKERERRTLEARNRQLEREIRRMKEREELFAEE